MKSFLLLILVCSMLQSAIGWRIPFGVHHSSLSSIPDLALVNTNGAAHFYSPNKCEWSETLNSAVRNRYTLHAIDADGAVLYNAANSYYLKVPFADGAPLLWGRSAAQLVYADPFVGVWRNVHNVDLAAVIIKHCQVVGWNAKNVISPPPFGGDVALVSGTEAETHYYTRLSACVWLEMRNATVANTFTLAALDADGAVLYNTDDSYYIKISFANNTRILWGHSLDTVVDTYDNFLGEWHNVESRNALIAYFSQCKQVIVMAPPSSIKDVPVSDDGDVSFALWNTNGSNQYYTRAVNKCNVWVELRNETLANMFTLARLDKDGAVLYNEDNAYYLKLFFAQSSRLVWGRTPDTLNTFDAFVGLWNADVTSVEGRNALVSYFACGLRTTNRH